MGGGNSGSWRTGGASSVSVSEVPLLVEELEEPELGLEGVPSIGASRVWACAMELTPTGKQGCGSGKSTGTGVSVKSIEVVALILLARGVVSS
jgi:hypothetical protein